MRILHIISSLAPRYGGPSLACLKMAQAVAKRGHHVEIFTTDIDGTNEVPVEGQKQLTPQNVSISWFPIQPPRFWRFSLPLAKGIFRRVSEFDIVHLHSLYLFPNLITGIACRKTNTPFIIRPHGTLDPFMVKHHRWRKRVMELVFENRNIQTASALHFTSTDEMDLARPMTGQTPGFVVPLGLTPTPPENWPPPGSFRKKFPTFQDKRLILFLGRVYFKKGLDLLVKALVALVPRLPDVMLLIAGPDDGYSKTIQELVSRAGLNDKVVFLPMVQGIEKLELLRDADLFVLPSYSENFGITVLEAMDAKLPVIISDRVNIWREVAEANAGLVTPCEPQALANAIQQILADFPAAQKRAVNGYQLLQTHFSWDQVGKDLEKQYQRLVDKPSR